MRDAWSPPRRKSASCGVVAEAATEPPRFGLRRRHLSVAATFLPRLAAPRSGPVLLLLEAAVAGVEWAAPDGACTLWEPRQLPMGTPSGGQLCTPLLPTVPFLGVFDDAISSSFTPIG